MKTAGGLLQRAGISYDICQKTGIRAMAGALLSRRLQKYNVVYHIGGVCDRPIDLLLPGYQGPLIWHWIGTDIVTWTKGKGSRGLRRILNQHIISNRVTVHLSDSPELADELAEIGIQAQVVRLLPEKICAEVQPLPAQPSVMSYWSDDLMDFYGGNMILELAREYPKVKFLITLARGAHITATENVTFLGPVDNIEEIYKQSTVFIRIPQHDSVSAMVLEMLARGRYVIYNKTFPHCSPGQNYQQIKESLDEIIQQDGPNIEGAQYVRENFSLEQQADMLIRVVSDLIG
ncbi:MAG: glycosyltransferase family 4 protein [Planctomycetes bacterium]|nr:glycosyltransferase family 4 protein [Planctomycetota bacterium]